MITLISAALAGLMAPGCDAATAILGGHRFSLEVANTEQERDRGLMERPSLPSGAGMVFAYPSARPVWFWMKDTPASLDMIFLDGEGVVRKIHANAKPNDETAIFGGWSIQYVIEVRAGDAASRRRAGRRHRRQPSEMAGAPAP